MAQISYVVIAPVENNENDFTLFQGWSDGVTEDEFLILLRIAATAPIDTGEIFLNQDSLIEYRASGVTKDIITIGSSLIKDLPDILRSQVVVFLTPSCHVDEVTQLKLPENVYPIVVAPFSNNPSVITFSKIDFDNISHSLDRAIFEVVEKYSHNNKDILPLIKSLRSEYNRTAGCPFYGSGVTFANEMVVSSLGLKFTTEKKINPQELGEFYKAIEDTVNSIKAVVPNKSLGEVILYSPSVKGMFYNTNSNLWNQILRNVKVLWHKEFVRKGLIKNPGYSGVTISFGKEKVSNPYQVPYVGEILIQRQKELAATNHAIAILATNELAPAIRLPNSVNLHQGKLRDIESIHARSGAKAERQLQIKFKDLSEELANSASSEIKNLLISSSSCKICSDAPLEWMYLEDLPLMVSHEVSKIPMTPGNMLLQHATLGAPKSLLANAFKDILIIRSFADSDRIKNLLEISIDNFDLKNGVSPKFVDVSKVSEVVDALNSFYGPVVIFDCHGKHGGMDQPGWLQIGGEKLDSWSLSNKARVPPIVMLSACSTAPITGSHASVANGFLKSGALSVIGTMLPVNAINSSAFVARIVFRLDAFLPAIRKLGYDLISWRTLISMFFKMSYTTDVLKHLQNVEKLIDANQYEEIHKQANHDINLLNADWYADMLERISNVSGLPAEEILKKIKDENPFVETMLYCQLGRPELLHIYLNDQEDVTV